MSENRSETRSAKSSAHEVIENHIDLKRKTGDGPARLTGKQIEQLEQDIASQRGVYLKYLNEDLKKLHALLHNAKANNKLSDEDKAQIYSISHRIRGEAPMNDRQAVGIIANLLCEFIEQSEASSEKNVSFIELHIGAMNAIFHAHGSGTQDAQILQIIEGFKAARQKLSAAG